MRDFYINKIIKIKSTSKKNIVSANFLIKKDNNIRIYYAPFDYINRKAKIMIVGITPGFQQMQQSFEAIKLRKSLKEVKDLSSFKGSMRTNLIKYLDKLKINNILNIKSCESLFNVNSKYLHATSLVKYPVFYKGKNYSGNNIIKKKLLLDFMENNFLKELKIFKNIIIVPLGTVVSNTIAYLNDKFNLNLKNVLHGFPHPSGLNIGKDKQFNNSKTNMLRVLKYF